MLYNHCLAIISYQNHRLVKAMGNLFYFFFRWRKSHMMFSFFFYQTVIQIFRKLQHIPILGWPLFLFIQAEWLSAEERRVRRWISFSNPLSPHWLPAIMQTPANKHPNVQSILVSHQTAYYCLCLGCSILTNLCTGFCHERQLFRESSLHVSWAAVLFEGSGHRKKALLQRSGQR